jgi:hypothetical protein
MRRSFALVTVWATLSMPGWTQGQVGSQVTANAGLPLEAESPFVLVPIPEGQTRVEAASLIFQSAVVGIPQSSDVAGKNAPSQSSVGGGKNTPSQSNVAAGKNAPSVKIPDMVQDAPNALRCYGITLAPGEQVKLHLKGKTGGAIFMKFLPKNPPDAMISQVRRANMPPAPMRASRIEITNITAAPYEVALMLYGQANYPYILELERKKKN